MMAHDPSLYAGGAALDALDEDESAQFDRHLVDCPTCQSELTGFRETAARLGAATAESAPASMRAAVMARIAVTRQLPPQVSHAAPGTDTAEQPDEFPAERSASPGLPEPRMAEVVDLSSRRRLTTRLLLSAAAVVAIAVIAMSTIFLINRNSSTNDANALRQCVNTASDQRQLPATADSTGVTDVKVSATCGGAVVQMSDIASPGAGKTYQLWVISGDQFRSVAILQPDASGAIPATVAQVHIGDTALGLTVEPAGGSQKPTTPPVVTVPLSV